MDEREYAKIIASNLRRIAFEHEKTQADISRDLKINKATLSSWMNGTRTPRMDKIDLLCHYFNVRRSDIMEKHEDDDIRSDSSDPYYNNPETAAIAQAVFDDPDLRLLFEAAQDVKPENIRLAAEMLRRFKETNPDG